MILQKNCSRIFCKQRLRLSIIPSGTIKKLTVRLPIIIVNLSLIMHLERKQAEQLLPFLWRNGFVVQMVGPSCLLLA